MLAQQALEATIRDFPGLRVDVIVGTHVDYATIGTLRHRLSEKTLARLMKTLMDHTNWIIREVGWRWGAEIEGYALFLIRTHHAHPLPWEIAAASAATGAVAPAGDVAPRRRFHAPTD